MEGGGGLEGGGVCQHSERRKHPSVHFPVQAVALSPSAGVSRMKRHIFSNH